MSALFCGLANTSERNNHDSTITLYLLRRTRWVITTWATGREGSTSVSAQVSCYKNRKQQLIYCTRGKASFNVFVRDRSARALRSRRGGRCRPGGPDPDSGAWRLDPGSPAEGAWDTEADSARPSWTVSCCTCSVASCNERVWFIAGGGPLPFPANSRVKCNMHQPRSLYMCSLCQTFCPRETPSSDPPFSPFTHCVLSLFLSKPSPVMKGVCLADWRRCWWWGWEWPRALITRWSLLYLHERTVMKHLLFSTVSE